MHSEIDYLYGIIGQLHSRIDDLITQSGVDEVTWRGVASFGQRCYRCGRWIDVGKDIAAIRHVGGYYLLGSGVIPTKYVHKECVRDE